MYRVDGGDQDLLEDGRAGVKRTFSRIAVTNGVTHDPSPLAADLAGIGQDEMFTCDRRLAAAKRIA